MCMDTEYTIIIKCTAYVFQIHLQVWKQPAMFFSREHLWYSWKFSDFSGVLESLTPNTRQPTHLWNWLDNLKDPYILMGQIPFPSFTECPVCCQGKLTAWKQRKISKAMSGRMTTERDNFPLYVTVFAKTQLLLMLQTTNKIKPDRCENKTWLCAMKLSEHFGLNYLCTIDKGCWSVLNH